ncbi:MAG: redox-regulated ATPase YchF [Longimicrobiales bacterium]
MMVQVGIVGLPNVGKSTLFNALTAAGAPAENYPFCTVEPNIGIVEVPDPRLEVIRALTASAASVPTHIRFVDIAGLVRGASEGEGLGNRFLAQIREVDAIAHVLRCFDDPDITHVIGSIDPLRDLEVVETELALADLDTLARRREKTEKKARSGEKDAAREIAILDRLAEGLSHGGSLRAFPMPPEAGHLLAELNLLTTKPVLYVANVGEKEMLEDSPELEALRASKIGAGVRGGLVKICSGLEAELARLAPAERGEFFAELGWEKGGLERVIQAAYRLLDLITFFTSNEKETRAWAVPRGTRAPEAAGLIHTEFQRGFIRAETIGFTDFETAGSLKVARELGVVRSEGREYEIQDGDLILFRFNV